MWYNLTGNCQISDGKHKSGITHEEEFALHIKLIIIRVLPYPLEFGTVGEWQSVWRVELLSLLDV